MAGRVVQFPTPRAFVPLLQPRRFKGAKGGRGGAKSHFFCERLVEEMLCEHTRAVCLREVQNSIKDSVKQLIEDKIRLHGLDDQFKTTEHEIRGPNDSLMIFKGLANHTAASIKSLEGFNRAFVEEAQTVSRRSLDLLTPTIRAPGSELWFAWNPSEATDPVDVHFAENEGDPDFECVTVNYWDNPWFPDELRADMERDKLRDPDKYAHVWCGQYRSLSEARVFRNWEVRDVPVPENVVWFYGVDWGFANDPMAGIKFCLPRPGQLYISDEVFEIGVATERAPIILGAGLPGIEKWPSAADSARPEMIDYCRRHGLPRMRPAIKGPGSVEDGISFLQGLDIMISPRCPNMAAEAKNYAYKTDRQTGLILPVVADAHNHGWDAVRYGSERLHRKVKATSKPEPVAKPRDDYGRGGSTSEDSWMTV